MQQLKMQKELLQLQRMIGELRMKKDVHELRSRFQLSKNLVPSIAPMIKNGLTGAVGNSIVGLVATKLVKKLFRRKEKVKR